MYMMSGGIVRCRVVSGATWWLVWAVVAGCVGGGGCGGGAARWAGSYLAESAAQLNGAARTDRDVGYVLRAALHVAPLAHQQHQHLLQFRLVSPKLYLRGKHVLAEYVPYDSAWDSYGDTTFYVHFKDGLIVNIYLDPEEELDVLNYKKSLASLFQVGAVEGGERNETDASGDCAVHYEQLSPTEFRKLKARCACDASVGGVSARRGARYTLAAGGGRGEGATLHSLFSDEVLRVGVPGPALKARSWVRLTRGDTPPPTPPPPAPHHDVAAALRTIPTALKPLPVQLVAHTHTEDTLDDHELMRALVDLSEAMEDVGETEGAGEEGKGGGEEGKGGGEEGEGGVSVAAVLVSRVVQAVRARSQQQVAALLDHHQLHAHLEVVCGVLGAACSAAAHRAVAHFAALESRDPVVRPALLYLAALSLAPRPDEWVVRDVLRLGGAARSPRVAAAALLAAGAAAPRTNAHTAAHVRDKLAARLAHCKDDACRAVCVSALGNMRRDDTAALLLGEALRGGGGALRAIDALDGVALTWAQLDALSDRVALNESLPLETRAAALDLVVRRRAALPAPLAPLARLAHALHSRSPHDAHAHELRRVLWGRLSALAHTNHEVARLHSLLDPALRTWDARAHAGTSSVLSREAWRGAGWRALLHSLQVARGGVLRRGKVALRATDDLGAQLDVLAVRVWARGLDAFGGDGDEAAEAAEEAGAGLSFDVGGVRVHDATLFEGRAELLGHVWAGTASTPTPVLRALLPAAPRSGVVPMAGGAVLRLEATGALVLALEAQAQASLWYRTARAELELRAGVAREVRARLRTAGAELSALARGVVAPRLRLAAHLDFYGDVALCVRADTAPHHQRHRLQLHSAGGARRLRVGRAATSHTRWEGRTLALGAPNDNVCRALHSHAHT